ncbi:MAG: hypothetical protein AVDCRST_MAG48-344, partial [uncultured Friedmanniella sp.]
DPRARRPAGSTVVTVSSRCRGRGRRYGRGSPPRSRRTGQSPTLLGSARAATRVSL